MQKDPTAVTSVGELADDLHIQSWRIARLFKLGLVPEPPRVSGRRVIPASMVPDIVQALQDRGWMPREEASP